jgi:thymidine phosphorylase
MVAALGGPAGFVERPEKYLAAAPVVRAAPAAGEGFVTGIATRDIGLAVVMLGGGRRRPEDRIDPAVGFSRLLPIGAQLRAGEALALVHARNDDDANMAVAAVQAAYAIGPSKPSPDRAVIRRIAPRR